MEHILRNGDLSVKLSLHGGTVMEWFWGDTPIFRPYIVESKLFAENCGCFPLVPFGNRMEGGALILNETRYSFPRNTEDAFYLHGDGWLADWVWEDRGQHTASMTFKHNGTFNYICQQKFILERTSLKLQLTIQNTNSSPMICGLGWHPYFHTPSDFFLKVECSHFWTEGKNHLPVERKRCLSRKGRVMKKWENTCFEGWNGYAEIHTEAYKVRLKTDPALYFFQTFMQEERDFFCFEPMGHRTNDFSLKSGVKILENEEIYTQHLILTLI